RHPGLDHGRRLRPLPGRPDQRQAAADQYRRPGYLPLPQGTPLMRPAQALIDLQALRHNYRLARQLGGGKALAIIKADAYGHGAVACARALQDEADGFGVACIEEALELRAAGIRGPSLLMEGFFDAAELPLIVEHDLWTVVATPWQLEAVEAFKTDA